MGLGPLRRDSLPVGRSLRRTAMSGRWTAERIDEARRAATRNRLIGERVTETTAEAWIAAWDAQAAREGLEPGRVYWDRGSDWMASQRGVRIRP